VFFQLIFFINYYFESKQQREFNAEIAAFQSNRALLNLLMNEAAAYSQQDSSINPVLELIGVKPTHANPGAPKTPAK